jgi:hypothetical protein
VQPRFLASASAFAMIRLPTPDLRISPGRIEEIEEE